MKPGTRVRVISGPWFERIGCEGVIVAPPADGTYPADPRSPQVIVLLDDDPLGATKSEGYGCVWTMRLAKVDLVEVAA